MELAELELLLTTELELLAELLEVPLELDMLLVELLILLDEVLEALLADDIEDTLLEVLLIDDTDDVLLELIVEEEDTLEVMLELLALAAALDELIACPPPEHAEVEIHASTISRQCRIVMADIFIPSFIHIASHSRCWRRKVGRSSADSGHYH